MAQDIHEKLDKMDSKIDVLADKLADVNVRLIEYNAELTRHIEGVQLAREENKILREFVHKENADIREDIKPIQEHVNRVAWTFYLFSIIAAIILGLNQLGLLKFGN